MAKKKTAATVVALYLLSCPASADTVKPYPISSTNAGATEVLDAATVPPWRYRPTLGVSP